MANNTTVDPIDYKNPKIKCLNLIKAKEHIQNLYKRYSSVADAINALIGQGDDTPNVIDNLSEAISITREVDTRRDDVYTHIHHTGDGTSAGPKEAFTATASGVKINYQCKHLLDNTYTQHSDDIPVASASQAGIITSEGGAFFDENTTGKVDTLDTLKDFLDGVEENITETIYGEQTNVTFTPVDNNYKTIWNSNLNVDVSNISDYIPVKIIIEDAITNLNRKFRWKSGYSNDTIWLFNGQNFKSLDGTNMGTLKPIYSSWYPASINVSPTGVLQLRIYGAAEDTNYYYPAAVTPDSIKIVGIQTTPLETRLDSKVDKQLSSLDDVKTYLKTIVFSNVVKNSGTITITLPFNTSFNNQSLSINDLSGLTFVYLTESQTTVHIITTDEDVVVPTNTFVTDRIQNDGSFIFDRGIEVASASLTNNILTINYQLISL